MAAERVQKILAQVGIASRRKAEELIVEGLVTINGKLAKLGDKAELGKDAIKVKGKLLQTKVEAPVYLAFNKPRGVISTLTDPEGRATLSEFLGKVKVRVFPVGRLDFNSEGLLLLTNDGNFTEKLQKRDDILRVYTVKVKGHLDEEMMERLKRPARLGPGKVFKPYSVRLSRELEKKAQVEVVVQGSGAFDLKAFFELKGFLVEKVSRTAIGHITLKGLLPGHFRYLKASQVEALFEQPELAERHLEQEAEKSRKIPLRTKVVIAPLAPALRNKTDRSRDRSPREKDSRDRTPRSYDSKPTPRRKPSGFSR